MNRLIQLIGPQASGKSTLRSLMHPKYVFMGQTFDRELSTGQVFYFVSRGDCQDASDFECGKRNDIATFARENAYTIRGFLVHLRGLQMSKYRIETTGDGAGIQDVVGDWDDLVDAVTRQMYSPVSDGDRVGVQDMLENGIDGSDGWNGRHVLLQFEDGSLSVSLVPDEAAVMEAMR